MCERAWENKMLKIVLPTSSHESVQKCIPNMHTSMQEKQRRRFISIYAARQIRWHASPKRDWEVESRPQRRHNQTLLNVSKQQVSNIGIPNSVFGAQMSLMPSGGNGSMYAWVTLAICLTELECLCSRLWIRCWQRVWFFVLAARQSHSCGPL